jgi:ubiquitin carboxyl-terminal hydrolase 36/42
VEPNFGGVTRTRVICNSCGSVTKRYQSFIELALWFIDDKTTTTESQLASFLAPEQLSGHNAYQCASCNGLRPAQKQTSIVRSPENLMICYKRFAFDTKTLTRRKILTTTTCPEILSVPVNIEADPESKESEGDGKAEEVAVKVKYQLYAAVMHSGRSAQCGHYYTIGRHSTNPETWYQFNDSFVSFSSFEAINSSYFTNDVPYLLFYRKIK